jgi:hypothetical protein
MILELIKNEKIVTKLERVAKEIEILKTKNTDFSHLLPIILMALELYRTSGNSFPPNFFNLKKSIYNNDKN